MTANHDMHGSEPEVMAGSARSQSQAVPGWRRRTRGLRRVTKIVALVLLPIVILATAAAVVVYVRLANGPVSLSYLKAPIEKQISDKLGGMAVKVTDVVLSLSGPQAEFRLKNVRVTNDSGAVVARAPLATMEIDRGALLGGRVQPTGIILIRPLMRLTYTPESGLSLSFKRSPLKDTLERAGSKQADPAGHPAPSTVQPTDPAAANNAKITVLKSIAGLLQGTNKGRSGTTALDRIGVRNALIEIDHAGSLIRWGVPTGDLNISRNLKTSVVSGIATIAATHGANFTVAFNAEAAAQSGNIAIRSSVSNLQSGALAYLPGLTAVSNLNVPLSAEAQFNLNRDWEMLNGRITVEARQGSFRFDKETEPLRIDHGRIVLEMNNADAGMTIAPSTLGWGDGNELVVSGKLLPSPEGDVAFAVVADRGHFVTEPGSRTTEPVKQWALSGRYRRAEKRLDIDQAIVAAAGGSLALKGSIFETGLSTIVGRIGPAPVRALSYLWPSSMAPYTRKWIRSNVVAGRIKGGQFNISTAHNKQELTLQGADIQILSPIDRRPFFASKMLLALRNAELKVEAPSAALRIGQTRALSMKQVSLDIPDIYNPQAIASFSFKPKGLVKDGLAVLSAMQLGNGVSQSFFEQLRKAKGRFNGDLKVAVPLYDQTGWTPTATGSVDISDLQVKDLISTHDLTGGSFKLQLAEKSVNAGGEMLIAGVAAKFAWQYIKDAPLESQPPARLSARLDEADRHRLGIKINHMVRGLVDVEINLIPRSNGRLASKVTADLTDAHVAVQSLAWVKPTGRQTLVEFDVVEGKQHPVVLDNLRVVGDGVAIQGRGMLDKNFQLVEFELPTFSIDRVTRLGVRGKLDKGKIWRVAVTGQTFEGRALFRSLFETGRAVGNAVVAGQKQLGLDLEAQVSNVIGFWNSNLRNVRLSLSKRQGKIQSMHLEGQLAENKLLKAAIVRSAGNQRQLHAFSLDAGKAFALVGFYPSAIGGKLELVVNLDARGSTDKSGVLLVQKFAIRGDEVVGELARATREGIKRRRARRAGGVNQSVYFDWMRVPFFIGNGQFILQGAELRGPVVGATIEGKADFAARRLDLSGTYIPLQGLNGALGIIPGLGQILAGPNGEGVLGMTFAVRGSMSQPEMLVNPLSLMAPGIFREIFQMSNPSLQVTPRAPKFTPPPSGSPPTRGGIKAWQDGAFGNRWGDSDR